MQQTVERFSQQPDASKRFGQVPLHDSALPDQRPSVRARQLFRGCLEFVGYATAGCLDPRQSRRDAERDVIPSRRDVPSLCVLDFLFESAELLLGIACFCGEVCVRACVV